jgi:4a-hydroxytetrahydrobiopterin dehydratase
MFDGVPVMGGNIPELGARPARRGGQARNMVATTPGESAVRKKLDAHQVTEHLRKLPHWRHATERSAIVREFVFADFRQAFSFMTQVALQAERHDHHPEWANVYNRVNITWATHEAGGVTEDDFRLATCCDEAYERFALVPNAKG